MPRVFTLGSGVDVITFNDGVDGDGVEWTLRTPVGWDDTPDVRRDSADLPLRDGERVVTGYRTGRTLALRGAIAHQDRDLVLAARDALVEKLAGLSDDVEFVAYETLPKKVVARRSSRMATTWYGPVLEWECDLHAADYRKYALTEVTQNMASYSPATDRLDFTSGSGADLAVNFTVSSGANLAIDESGTAGVSADVTVTNDGNVEVYPVLLFYGPTSGSTTLESLTNLTTGVVVTLNITLVPGDVFVIDMRVMGAGAPNNAVEYNGDPSWFSRWLEPRTPMSLVPGDNTLRFQVLSGSQTATATVRYASGWE